MDEELKSKLIMGLPIDTCGLTIKNYTIGEIFKYGLNKHRHLIGLSVVKPKDILENPNHDDIKDLEIYDLMCIFEPLRKWFIDMMFYLSGRTLQYNEIFNKFFDLLENGEKLIIGKKECGEIFDVIRKMYCLSDTSKKKYKEINPDMAVDDETRELAKEFLEFKEENFKKKGDSSITLNGIIRAIATSNMGYTWKDILDMSTVCLMETYYGMEIHMNYHYTMVSICTGNQDKDSIKKINFNEIHYAKDIEL